MTTLALCKLMGMSYDDVRALPREVYDVLIEHAAKEREAA